MSWPLEKRLLTLVSDWQQELDDNPRPFVRLTVEADTPRSLLTLHAQTFARNQEVHTRVRAPWEYLSTPSSRRHVTERALIELLREVYT